MHTAAITTPNSIQSNTIGAFSQAPSHYIANPHPSPRFSFRAVALTGTASLQERRIELGVIPDEARFPCLDGFDRGEGSRANPKCSSRNEFLDRWMSVSYSHSLSASPAALTTQGD